MDALFEKDPLKKDMLLYRGGFFDEVQALFGSDNPNAIIGKEITLKQYLSTTSNKGYGIDYSEDNIERYLEASKGYESVTDYMYENNKGGECPVLFRIHAKKGSKVIERSKYTDVSGRAGDSEWTIGHGNKYKIKKVDFDDFVDYGGKTYQRCIIDMELRK